MKFKRITEGLTKDQDLQSAKFDLSSIKNFINSMQKYLKKEFAYFKYAKTFDLTFDNIFDFFDPLDLIKRNVVEIPAIIKELEKKVREFETKRNIFEKRIKDYDYSIKKDLEKVNVIISQFKNLIDIFKRIEKQYKEVLNYEE